MRLPRAIGAGAVTLLAVGVPTDIIDTPWFGREIPVRWWEYPVLAATVTLTAVWFGIRPRAPETRATGPLAGVMLTVFAVGCPVCNKIVLLAIGTSGALGFWAPLQPVLAILSLALLTGAVVLRWRRRPCGSECALPSPAEASAQPPSAAQ
ncbi:hypothetical protein [Rhodococcus sp. ABRD24]|uniref:hypothetical protein n=1 Tax=Rhodococcus sp. ABRD24 TaxID=2507582 RepID=UPI001F624E47|nr:hypothetical protein [Rhodococcus sp. ABRD24]